MTLSTFFHPSAARSAPERVTERTPTVAPLVDVFENANEILLWADVPGAARDGVSVQVDKGQLTLSARRPVDANGAATQPRAYDYHRVFAVPAGIDATKIEAELRDGVLKVRLPKSEALRPRRIEVKAG
jgi:HSP20 family molecular chaperone IbpA